MSNNLERNWTVSHIGICVADLDRSVRFYCDGLGFSANETFHVDNEIAPLMELVGAVRITSRFVKKDGLRIDLMYFEEPPVQSPPSRKALNQPGLTHLCIRVAEVDETVEAIRKYGGNVLDHTRVRNQHGEFVYCTDPDGVRLELMCVPDALQLA